MPAQLSTVWPKVEPLLRRVVKPRTGWTLTALYAELLRGGKQLWAVGDFVAVVVTLIDPRPLENVLWVQFLAGANMDDWLDDLKVVMEAFAKAHGCAAVEFSGRKGWNKLNAHYPDYHPVLTTFRKELNDGRQ